MFESILSLSVLLLAHPLSTAARHHSLADRPDSELQEVLVLKGEWCGSGEQATNYLPESVCCRRLKRKKSLTFQYIQTYAAKLVDVWVVDFRKEPDFGWRHGVIIGKKELEFENTG